MDRIAGTQMGVYMATFAADYDHNIRQDPLSIPTYFATGAAGRAIFANRISYFFDLKGPSLAIDTACSGSLVALHVAIKSIQSGECKAALVGGSGLFLNPDLAVGLSNLK
jgi:acyl transferase domain-containing protein